MLRNMEKVDLEEHQFAIFVHSFSVIVELNFEFLFWLIHNSQIYLSRLKLSSEFHTVNSLTLNLKSPLVGFKGICNNHVSVGKESSCNAGDLGSISGLERSLGEGNGKPLQYSCLENPVDRGDWQVTVHGVAESRTRLSDKTHTRTGNCSQRDTTQDPARLH